MAKKRSMDLSCGETEREIGGKDPLEVEDKAMALW
jgi:hypothetical protein